MGTSVQVRDWVLVLLKALVLEPMNAEALINRDCLELLVDLMTTAHTHEITQRATPMLQVCAWAGSVRRMGPYGICI